MVRISHGFWQNDSEKQVDYGLIEAFILLLHNELILVLWISSDNISFAGA